MDKRIQAGLDLGRAECAQHRAHARVHPLQQRCKARGHGLGAGHHADHQPASGRAGPAGQGLAQAFSFMQQAVGMGQGQFTLGGQPFVLAATPHDGGAQAVFQRPDGVGQRRLGDVAGLRRPAEVAVFGQGGQVAQRFEQVHGRPRVARQARRLGRSADNHRFPAADRPALPLLARHQPPVRPPCPDLLCPSIGAAAAQGLHHLDPEPCHHGAICFHDEPRVQDGSAQAADPQGCLAVLLPRRQDRHAGHQRLGQELAAEDHGRRRQGIRGRGHAHARHQDRLPAAGALDRPRDQRARGGGARHWRRAGRQEAARRGVCRIRRGKRRLRRPGRRAGRPGSHHRRRRHPRTPTCSWNWPPTPCACRPGRPRSACSPAAKSAAWRCASCC